MNHEGVWRWLQLATFQHAMFFLFSAFGSTNFWQLFRKIKECRIYCTNGEEFCRFLDVFLLILRPFLDWYVSAIFP